MSVLQTEGRRRVRHLRENDPHASETHFVELDPLGIHTWCSHADAKYQWRDFSKACEPTEFFLFVRPSGAGAAVPKRLLQDGQDVELRNRIREWAPELGADLAQE
jgi:GNAT superfamily N-acetyltransferase